MDAFAREGVVFENAMAQSSWCLPNFATLFTGQPPEVHGLYSLSLKKLPGSQVTLAQRLKEAGYDVPNVPQVRGIVAPPGVSKEAVAYYEDLFARVAQSASWKKYLEDNQFDDGFQRSTELSKFFDEFSETMRNVLKEAGVKVVR